MYIAYKQHHDDLFGDLSYIELIGGSDNLERLREFADTITKGAEIHLIKNIDDQKDGWSPPLQPNWTVEIEWRRINNSSGLEITNHLGLGTRRTGESPGIMEFGTHFADTSRLEVTVKAATWQEAERAALSLAWEYVEKHESISG